MMTRYRTIKSKYVFACSLIRVLLFLIEQLTIQNYVFRNNSMVDFVLNIRKESIIYVFTILCKSLLQYYHQLITLTCIDHLGLLTFKQMSRFSLVYIINQINTSSRLTIEVYFSEKEFLPSISNIYKNANWLEREVYDLFGIFFTNHSDLRRILTDYGFQGFPLRKDFPLTGYLELKFSEKNKNIQYKELKLMQEFRVFNFKSPWITALKPENLSKKV